jgi:hypothetical protein
MSAMESEPSVFMGAIGAAAPGWDVGGPNNLDCPYEFALLPAEILGLPVRGRTQTGLGSEQPLGKAVKLTVDSVPGILIAVKRRDP